MSDHDKSRRAWDARETTEKAPRVPVDGRLPPLADVTVLLAQITTLTRERDEVLHLLAEYEAASLAREMRFREALTPFADAEDHIGEPSRMPDMNSRVYLGSIGLNVGHIRAARAALAETSEPIKEPNNV